MKRTMMVPALALVAVLTFGLSGCEEKKTAGEPPIQLGLGPGETASYEPTSAPAEPLPPPPVDFAPREVVEPALTAPPPLTTTNEPAAAVRGLYTIKKGDTLIGLARRYYNDERKWKEIWTANRERIPNPNRIMPGLEIVLP